MTDQEKITVAAAVIRVDGKYLITKRTQGTHLAGYWEFPGGKVEKGETTVDALTREILEEVGLEIRVNRLLHESFPEYPERSVHMNFYDCDILSGDATALECTEIAWIKPDEFKLYEFPPADEGIIEMLSESDS